MSAATRLGGKFSITLGVFAALSSPVQAGTVSGSIDLPDRPTSTAPADLYGKYCGDCGATHEPVSGYAVVCLRETEGVVSQENRPVVTMDQNGTRFVPRILPVQVGDRVRFLNSDPVFHNVFSLSPAKKFDLGRYPKGGSKIVTFDRAGVIQVFCDIHAEMVGFVVVVDSPYYTSIDLAGKYSIPHVPGGEYEVLVWSEGMTQFASVGEVKVPASGSTEFTASLVERP
jgi:plastocyanin